MEQDSEPDFDAKGTLDGPERRRSGSVPVFGNQQLYLL